MIALRRHLIQAQWVLLGLALAGLALHAAWIGGMGEGSIDTLVNEWVYNAVLVLASAACLLKAAISPGERWIWLCFGLGLGAWTAADIYWTLALIDVKHPPYPSLADAGYLLVYPFMYVGVLLLVRRRVRFSTSAWLDGAIGGLVSRRVRPFRGGPELRRCAGSQFDPQLVELFADRVLPRLTAGHDARGAAPAPLPDSAASGPAAVREVVDGWPVFEHRVV